MQCESELKNIQADGITLESNEEKAEAFAKAFSDISSNKNYTDTMCFEKSSVPAIGCQLELGLTVRCFTRVNTELHNNNLYSPKYKLTIGSKQLEKQKLNY